MAKNTKQIEALKAQVAEFSQKMDELKKKNKGKTDAELEADAEYQALLTQAEEISSRIEELEQEDEGEDPQVAELREKLAAQEQSTKEMAERIARMEQSERNAAIGTRVSTCKIPAFRSALSALYAYALTHADQKVKIYSKDKDGKDTSEDRSLADVVDTMVTEINAQSEKLFQALAYSGKVIREDGIIDENPGEAVQKRVVEYRKAHPEVKEYSVALQAVLTADPELAKKYSEQSGTQQ